MTRFRPSTVPGVVSALTALCALALPVGAQGRADIVLTPAVGYGAPSTVLDAPWELNFSGPHASKRLRVRLEGHATYGAMLDVGLGSPAWRLRTEYTAGPGRAAMRDCYYDGIQCWDLRPDASVSQLSLALARRFAPRWSGGLGMEASVGVADSRLRLDNVVQSPLAPDYDEHGMAVELGGALSREIGRQVALRVDGRVSRVRVDLERFERYWLADNIGGVVYFRPFGSAEPALVWGIRGGLSLHR